MKFDIQSLAKKLAQLPSVSSYYIAFSGGMDSTVLLHALARLSLDIPLHAIYIDHGLQPESMNWTTHCQQFCQQYQIKFQAVHLNLKPQKGESIEAIARTARYQVLQQMIPKNSLLMTAQHADDQVETVLLQLLRGSGVKGLAAMPFCKPWNQGWHVRPLLEYDQQTLREYALEQQLEWIEDPSNQEIKFERNYLRLKVIPLLKDHWSGLTKTIPRSALHCAESEQLNQQTAELVLQKISNKKILNGVQLLKYDPLWQKYLLRQWIAQSGFLLPNTKRLNELQRLISCSNSGLIHWKNTECRLYQQQLYLMKPLKNLNLSKILEWHLNQKILQLPSSLGYLECDSENSLISVLNIRFRQNTQISKLNQPSTNKHLKKIFQTHHIPPWQRSTIPLIFYQNKLIQVGNFWQHPCLKKQKLHIKWIR